MRCSTVFSKPQPEGVELDAPPIAAFGHRGHVSIYQTGTAWSTLRGVILQRSGGDDSLARSEESARGDPACNVRGQSKEVSPATRDATVWGGMSGAAGSSCNRFSETRHYEQGFAAAVDRLSARAENSWCGCVAPSGGDCTLNGLFEGAPCLLVAHDEDDSRRYCGAARPVGADRLGHRLGACSDV